MKQHSRFLGSTTLVLAALFLFSTGGALAQTNDHQTCFKVKDSRKFSALVDLTMEQPQFTPPSECRVVGKGKLFCVPTKKTVNEFIVDSAPGTLLDVPGPDMLPDRICYKVKCARADLAPEVVTDQFGSGTLEKFKIKYLCTPAIKGLPTTTTTTTTTLPCTSDCTGKVCGDDGCGGTCGTCSGLDACIVFSCQPIPCGGVSGIPCPSGLTCIEDPTGNCRLDCGDTDCPGICATVSATPPPCGGITCPFGHVCVGVAGDACDQLCGGVDCPGMCVEPPPDQ